MRALPNRNYLPGLSDYVFVWNLKFRAISTFVAVVVFLVYLLLLSVVFLWWYVVARRRFCRERFGCSRWFCEKSKRQARSEHLFVTKETKLYIIHWIFIRLTYLQTFGSVFCFFFLVAHIKNAFAYAIHFFIYSFIYTITS